MANIHRQLDLALLKAKVEAITTHCILQATVTNYVTVAKATGTFSGGKDLAEVLGFIMKDDAKAGRPLSCSVVVRSDTGRPGKGYFVCARDLGLDCPDTPAGEEGFWRAQISALKVVAP